MDDKNWRVKQLEKTQEEHEQRLDDLDKFKYSTVEKLKTIFERLKEIENTNRWVSRSFFYAIFTGAVGVVFSLVIWLLEKVK